MQTGKQKANLNALNNIKITRNDIQIYLYLLNVNGKKIKKNTIKSYDINIINDN